MNREIKFSILLLYILFWAIFLIVTALVDYFSFHRAISLTDILLYNVPPHDIYIRKITFVLFAVFGVIFYILLSKREKVEKLLTQTNMILSSIRDINKLITIEKDPGKLISETCNILVKKHGFSKAWILIFSKEGVLKYSAESGVGVSFDKLLKKFSTGNMPSCLSKTSESDEVCVIDHSEYLCGECELADDSNNKYLSMVYKLAHEKIFLGYISVSINKEKIFNLMEYKKLFKEIADDLAFAVWSSELEREKRLSEERYKALFENAVNGIVVLKYSTEYSDFIIFDMNKPAENIEKINRKDAIGKNAKDVFYYLETTGLYDTVGRVYKTGKAHNFPVSSYKEGKIVFWRDNYIYRLETGEVVIIFKDETKRKNTEVALEVSEKKYRVLFDNSPDAIFIFDPVNLNFIEVNKVACDRLGYTRDELIKKNLPSISSPKYALLINDRIKQIFESGHEFYETEHVHKNGSIIPSEASSTIIKYDVKPVILSVVRDITLRKMNERSLRENEKKMNAFFDNSPSLIYIKDLDGNYIVANNRFKDLIGIPSEKIEGKTDFDIFPHDFAAKFRENDLGVLKKGKAVEYEEVINIGDDERTYMSIKFPLPDSAGNPIGVCGISTDITERKKLESKFLQAQKMETVARLAGGIAHDFNNILTVIVGYNELLLTNFSQDDPIYNELQEVMKTIDRATNLIGQLLTFSRRQVFNPVILDLNDKLFEMDKMMRRIIGEDVELIMIPGEDLWPVKIDISQLEQVITNLVVNARDAMPGGGKLTIETYNVNSDIEYPAHHPEVIPGDYVFLAFSDTGTGMSDEVKSHVFEPFFTTKENGRGTGLGLSTCYGIIKQSGGDILVYSEPGNGTTINIYLPRESGEFKKSLKQESFENAPEGSETILLVEDESNVRKMASRVLSRKGYKIIEASNGEEALRFAENYLPGKIDILLTDVIMPHMGGVELSEKIKEKNPKIKVLFISGYTENSIVHNGVLDHGIFFLQKPFTSYVTCF